MFCPALTALLPTLLLAPADLPRPRVIVLTDIGGDPDDQQSMIRLMLYANRFDIEGLVASASGTPGELKENVVKPHLIREIVDAYGEVRESLARHEAGYPSVEALRGVIKSGNPRRGVDHLGAEHDTEGSRWIIEVVDRDDPRPVNVTIWGGSTELAQALWRVRADRGPEGLAAFVDKLRVYDIDQQDDTGPWILEQFPELFYILAKSYPRRDKREGAYRGMYLGGDESSTSKAWIDQHVHGPLGALYPRKTWTAPNPNSTLKEGDTPSWLYFLPTGLSDPAHPEWGSWGGRFTREPDRPLYRDAVDTVAADTPRDDATSARATVWRWRPAFQADFAARMDWTIQPPAEANHAPLAIVDDEPGFQPVVRQAAPGAAVTLDAGPSRDPDGDALTYRWWVYPEAGTYAGDVSLQGADSSRATLTVPADAAAKTIHIILEVIDDGEPALRGYRRVVVEVAG